MARLNPYPHVSPVPAAVVKKKPQSKALALAKPSSNVSSLSFTSREDLSRVIQSTDVDDLKKYRDVTVLLARAQEAILARTAMSEAITSHGAKGIESIWNHIATFEQKHPAAGSQIQQWREELNGHLGDRKIEYWLGLNRNTQDRITSYEATVRKNWQVSPMDLLEPKYYPGKALSKGMLQNLAELSRHATQEEGQTLILESIDSRCRLRNRKMGVSRERVLTLTDLKSSVKQARERSEAKDADTDVDVELSDRPRKRLKTDNEADQGSRTPRPASVAAAESAHGADNAQVASPGPHQDQQGNDVDSRPNSPASSEDSNKSKSDDAASISEETEDLQGASDDADESTVPCDSDMGDVDGKSPISADQRRGPVSHSTVRARKKSFFMNAADIDQAPSPERGRNYVKPNDAAQDDQEFDSEVENDLNDLNEDSIDRTELDRTQDMDGDQDIGPADISDVPNLPPSTPFPTSRRTQRRYDSPHPTLPTNKSTSSTSLHLPSGIPTSDVEGALGTLQPRQRLSATALEKGLAALTQDDTLMLDPQVYDMDTDKVGRVPSVEDSTRLILLPINHSTMQHWTLAVFRMNDGIVEHHDSLSGHDPPAKSIRRLCRMAEGFKKRSWMFKQQSSAQQTNGYDCGVFVLITAIFVLAGLDPPAYFDCVLWRIILRAMVRGNVEGQGDESSEGVSDSDAKITTTNVSQSHDSSDVDIRLREVLEDLQRDRMKFHQIRKLVQAARQAIDVLTQLQSQCNLRLSAAKAKDQAIQQELSDHKEVMDKFGKLTSMRNDHILGLMNGQHEDAKRQHNRTERKMVIAQEQITKMAAAIQTAEKIRNRRMTALREADERQRHHAERAARLKKQYCTSIKAIDEMCGGASGFLFRELI